MLPVRAGEWRKIGGIGLRGRTLGIIGVGDIGKQIALRGLPFGVNLIGNDVKEIDRAFLTYTRMKMVPRLELCATADFIVLACDLNDTSYHVVSSAEVGAMKETAMLVNVARGALVDTEPVATALIAGRIAGAAFDVYEEEPLPADSALRRSPE